MIPQIVCRGAVAAVLIGFALPAAAEPLVGVEAGATIPTSSSRSAADPGAAIGVNAGYRVEVASWIGLSLLGGGGITLFETKCGSDARICTDDDVTTLLSLTAGPRLSLRDGDLEVFLGVRGGVYRGVSGGLTETAGGFGLEAGAVYSLVEGTTAGAFIRREQVDLRPSRGDADLEFLVIGLGFEHRFAAPPRAVSQPRPRPEF